MHPITLRIPNDLLSDIESEADELGYSSRAEYIRQLLQNRAHAREALSTETTEPVVDPNAVKSNTEQIEAITEDLETILNRVEQLEQKIQTNSSDTDSNEATTTQTSSDTISQEATTPLDKLETWLEEHGPQSDNAVAIIKEAATILKEDGPLKAGELKEQLYEAYPDAYGSKNTLWGSTVDRVYEDAPGFSKPKYGTYAFG
jgi:Arc/MetJ-type ribon-helix-helix transcriptional regulator